MGYLDNIYARLNYMHLNFKKKMKKMNNNNNKNNKNK